MQNHEDGPKGYGVRLKQLRKRKGITAQELSRLTKITRSQIVNYENEKQVPSGRALFFLTRDLDTTTDYILRGPKIVSQESLNEKIILATQRINNYPEDEQERILYALDLWDKGIVMTEIARR